jgi:hypothetical protein
MLPRGHALRQHEHPRMNRVLCEVSARTTAKRSWYRPLQASGKDHLFSRNLLISNIMSPVVQHACCAACMSATPSTIGQLSAGIAKKGIRASEVLAVRFFRSEPDTSVRTRHFRQTRQLSQPRPHGYGSLARGQTARSSADGCARIARYRAIGPRTRSPEGKAERDLHSWC